MKTILLVGLLLFATLVFAGDALKKTPENGKEEWRNTSLSDDVIKKIQASKYEYNKCVSSEMQKKDYAKIDTRNATEAIIKQCEKVLSAIRTVYIEAEVPEVVADRHLRQIRVQTMRGVLQQMMYVDAVRKSGQIEAAKVKP